MQVENLRSLIRESINEYIREIDNAANEAAMDARITKCEEAIQLRQERLNKINENDDLKEMVDETKMKTIQNEIKILEKAKKKYTAQREKMQAKKDKKENPKQEVTTDAPIDEADVTAEMNMSEDGMKEEALNESFLKMQKLAGIITEAQYNQKKNLTLISELETTPDEKPDSNIEALIKRIQTLTPQLKANDTPLELKNLIMELMDLIQTINKGALNDQEVIRGLVLTLQAKKDEMKLATNAARMGTENPSAKP